MTPGDDLDLPAYLARVGYAGELRPAAQVLSDLHFAHATSVTFENLDILLGRPIRIDLGSIQAKIVRDRRGGYCFEQNRLFAAALEALGFQTTFLAARVRYRANRVLPRTHVLLLVEAEGERWVADVGFGTVGLMQPIPLAADVVSQQFGWEYQLTQEGRTWTLHAQLAGEWQPLYEFTLEPQYVVDLEMANHYVSTHPDSRFVQALIAQRSTPEARYLLRNLDLIVNRGGEETARTLREEELPGVLAEQFDLHFEPGTRFRILEKQDHG
jgi:N-hydroxyarylamine O-acetyltransferase